MATRIGVHAHVNRHFRRSSTEMLEPFFSPLSWFLHSHVSMDCEFINMLIQFMVAQYGGIPWSYFAERPPSTEPGCFVDKFLLSMGKQPSIIQPRLQLILIFLPESEWTLDIQVPSSSVYWVVGHFHEAVHTLVLSSNSVLKSSYILFAVQTHGFIFKMASLDLLLLIPSNILMMSVLMSSLKPNNCLLTKTSAFVRSIFCQHEGVHLSTIEG